MNEQIQTSAVAREPTGWRWLPLTGVIIALDQITKWIIVDRFDLYERIRVLPVLDITRMHNPGAAFSFLAGQGGWQRWLFTALALGVGIAIVVWLGKLKAGSQRMLAAALALILGGAVGNLIDRVRLGHVVDFIYVHWQEKPFPAFNIADSSITIGACLLLLDAFFESRRAKQQGGPT
jgi:signal peptidase II